jgi:hypothetical protein
MSEDWRWPGDDGGGMDFGDSDVMFGGGKTTVVNLKREPYDVYIGRAGRVRTATSAISATRAALPDLPAHLTAGGTLGC